MVCKCMKSVFVQCELWCEEILRRVARPCCTCSRHVSSQAVADLSPARHLRISPGATHFGPGIDISLRPCPADQRFAREPGTPSCPAVRPSSYCPGGQTAPTHDATRDPTASYYMHATDYDGGRQQRWPFSAPHHEPDGQLPRSRSSPTRSLLRGESAGPGYHATSSIHQESDTTVGSFHTPRSGSPSSDAKFNAYRSSPTTMYARVEYNHAAEREHRPRSPGDRNIEPELSRASSGCSTRKSKLYEILMPFLLIISSCVIVMRP